MRIAYEFHTAVRKKKKPFSYPMAGKIPFASACIKHAQDEH